MKTTQTTRTVIANEQGHIIWELFPDRLDYRTGIIVYPNNAYTSTASLDPNGKLTWILQSLMYMADYGAFEADIIDLYKFMCADKPELITQILHGDFHATTRSIRQTCRLNQLIDQPNNLN